MTYILSFIVAFGVTAIAGQILIPVLRRLKAGQSIREDGPTWHLSKQGTPTMGGLMFILGIGIAVLTAGWEDLQNEQVLSPDHILSTLKSFPVSYSSSLLHCLTCLCNTLPDIYF